MLGLDSGKGPCFQYQLKRCDGACAGDETPEEHNARLLSVLDRDRIAAWPSQDRYSSWSAISGRKISNLPSNTISSTIGLGWVVSTTQGGAQGIAG